MEQMTAQEALDSVKGITFEKAWAIMMEDRRKWEAEQKKQEAEQKKREAEQKKEDAKRKKEWDAWIAKMDEREARLDKKLGWLSNSLGELTEALFSGSLHKHFEKFGYDFDSQTQDKIFYETVDGVKDGVREADIWLENGEYVMAIEIKTSPKNADIDEHIERILDIRRLMDKKGDKRIIVGAIAGGVFKPEVKRYTHKKGFYVIVQSGESVKVASPKNFKARKW